MWRLRWDSGWIISLLSELFSYQRKCRPFSRIYISLKSPWNNVLPVSRMRFERQEAGLVNIERWEQLHSVLNIIEFILLGLSLTIIRESPMLHWLKQFQVKHFPEILRLQRRKEWLKLDPDMTGNYLSLSYQNRGERDKHSILLAMRWTILFWLPAEAW